MMKTRNQLILSLAFFLSSLALWHKVVPQETVTPPTVATSAVVAHQTQVEGVWEQYSLENGEEHFMARLDIRPVHGDFVAYPESVSANTYPKHAYRSFDHIMQNQRWSFKEDWGSGLIGNFDLVQVSETEYEGVALGSDGHMFHTKFVRLSR